MYCNASATLYHYDHTTNKWTSTYFDRVYWYESAATVAEKAGLVIKQTTKVFIPFSGAVAPDVNLGKDFIVKGQGTAIDNSSEQKMSESIKNIVNTQAQSFTNGGVPTVKGYSPCLFGSRDMRHLEMVVY